MSSSDFGVQPGRLVHRRGPAPIRRKDGGAAHDPRPTVDGLHLDLDAPGGIRGSLPRLPLCPVAHDRRLAEDGGELGGRSLARRESTMAETRYDFTRGIEFPSIVATSEKVAWTVDDI